MQNTSGAPSYSGFGPNSFNKRQLLEIIRMRVRSGKPARRNYTVDSLEETPRKSLVSEAKRLRKPYAWSYYANNGNVMRYAGQ